MCKYFLFIQYINTVNLFIQQIVSWVSTIGKSYVQQKGRDVAASWNGTHTPSTSTWTENSRLAFYTAALTTALTIHNIIYLKQIKWMAKTEKEKGK